MTAHAVVIAGGGPTGLMLAGELALARINVAVVERRESQSVEGLRAGGLHMRTIEVFDQRGIADRFVSQGQISRRVPFGDVMLDASDLPTRHNYFLALWQSHIERILAEWVRELSVPIYYGREVTDFSQGEAGVEIELSDGDSLRAEYLVGCDGGRSLVRKIAGIDFLGWDATTSYLIAEIETNAEPQWGVRRGERGINAIAKLADGKRARVVMNEGLVAYGEPTLESVRQALQAVYGTDFDIRSANFVSRFTDAARQAARYRQGRVMLAGDAAHVHSPHGGQGLNIGVQDAVNLGWKLAQVIHGKSPVSLLESYHAERHPVAARVLRNTMALGTLECGGDRMGAVRAMISEFMQRDEARKHYVAMQSGLDVQYDFGDKHPLLGRRMPDLDLDTGKGPLRLFTLLHGARPMLLRLDECCVIDIKPWASCVQLIDAKYDGALELPVLGKVDAPKAVLIRPDGYVAWVGDQTRLGLTETLTKWFGPAAAA